MLASWSSAFISKATFPKVSQGNPVAPKQCRYSAATHAAGMMRLFHESLLNLRSAQSTTPNTPNHKAK